MNTSEDRYRSLLDLLLINIDEIFILVDKDLRILLLNLSSLKKIPFINAVDVKPGMFLLDIPGFEQRKDAIKEMCMKAFKGIITESEPRYELEDGSFKYYHSVYKPALNSSGDIEAVIISARDITERKLAESNATSLEVHKQRVISQAIIDTQENERTEIGKELHDNVNQVLSTVKLYLEMAKTNTELKDSLLDKSIENINAVIEEIRKISKALMSYSINELGLIASIHELVENINLVKRIRINVQSDGFNEERLGDNQKLMFFRIVQEALSNIIKHSFATSVNISIKEISDKILLSIKDNGKGFDVNQTRKGIGVYNIQSRVSMFNGSLLVNSAPGKGCELRVEIPKQDKAV